MDSGVPIAPIEVPAAESSTTTSTSTSTSSGGGAGGGGSHGGSAVVEPLGEPNSPKLPPLNAEAADRARAANVDGIGSASSTEDAR